ncbi:serine hydrolase domain-containing protein [Streptomyces sp. NPDC052682]|uniref:serine hydrolase domain-containing protein n=1 Tax=Streptomyces sp. NPDC052682 TaxID=3154954 RepID=UPI00343593A3
MTVEEAVAEADARIRRETRFAHTEHLVVVHGDRTVAAHAYGERALHEPGDVYSVTKSVLSTLIGCAVHDDRLHLDATVAALLGGAVPEAFREVSVRHLLTMTGGTDPSGPYDIDAVMALPAGWTNTLLTAPRLARPGTRFRYDNGAAHLLAACLQRALGEEDLEAYAVRRLFAPLGITRRHWPRDPEGVPYGFGHLRLAPPDLVALARLWLAAGVAPEGHRLFSAAYAAEATRAHTAGGPPEGVGYGYLWWVTELAGRPAYFAGGYAGQHVVVVPSLDLITVTTGAEAALRPGWRPALDLVPGIVAAAAGAAGSEVGKPL